MRRRTCTHRLPSPLMLTALALAACAGPSRQQEIAYARQALVGMPLQTLLSCAGVPARRAQVEGTDFLTYASRSGGGYYSGPTTSVGVSGGSGGTGVGIGIGIPIFNDSVPSACEATFTVDRGVVRQLQYTSGSDPRQCYRIVENCLALVPGQPHP